MDWQKLHVIYITLAKQYNKVNINTSNIQLRIPTKGKKMAEFNKEKALTFFLKNIPTEQEIMAKWKERNKIKVSICMLSYNHEKFLNDAIDSILVQKTNFPFELLIHDDASQDKSQKIIKSYAEKYPNIVKPILQLENQHSQRINPSVHFNYPRCTGEYIAFLEGDDFWTNEEKLQIQAQALDTNKNINLCFHKATRINYFNKNGENITIGEYSNKDKIVSYEDIFFRTHGMVPTGSCMIRKSAKENLRTFMKLRPYLTLGDLFMQFFGAYPNGAYYINKNMSAYRFGTNGSWTANIVNDPEHKIRHEKSLLLAYTELNKLTNNTLNNEINKIHLQRLIWFFRPKHVPNTTLQPSILDKISTKSEILKDTGVKQLLPKFEGIQTSLLDTLNYWQSISGKKIIYGAGSGCNLILNTIGSLNIDAIIDRDRNRVGSSINSAPIISIDELKNYSEYFILVSIPSSDKAKLNLELIKHGANQEKILYLFESALAWLSNNPLTENMLFELKESHNFGKINY